MCCEARSCCWGPGNAAAVQRLVREQAPTHGKRLLRSVWGVRKRGHALALPEQAARDNPLLATMWARYQEGCRLLYAAGAFYCRDPDLHACWPALSHPGSCRDLRARCSCSCKCTPDHQCCTF